MILGIVAAGFIALQKPSKFDKLTRQLLERLDNLNSKVRWGLFTLLIVIPIPIILTKISFGVINNTWLRLSMLLPILLLAALIAPFTPSREYWKKFLTTCLIASGVFIAVSFLFQVRNYPFSIGWSEGNRFYDYSLIFARDIYDYNGELNIPYYSPGRYGLWGIWFLIPELPIWFHRLWNAMLWILPPLALGWLVGQGCKDRKLRLVVMLWTAIFITQGPIYAPILIAAIPVLIDIRSDKLAKRILLLMIASLYAGLSRWTWALAPGIWGALIDLYIHYPRRTGSWFTRLLPAVLLGAAGTLPGILANWPRFIKPQESTLSLSQPLLWYRLLPNATYPNGIILGLVIAAGPVAILLIWLVISKRWQLGWIQQLAGLIVSVGFLTAGLIISTKIGGGSNLHNLDMFMVTLTVLIALYLVYAKKVSPKTWPHWSQFVLLLAVLIPAWNAFARGIPFSLPSDSLVNASLQDIQQYVADAKGEGEILFLDQRQLLTFGEITDVPLVPEYEKKYLMDQAMAGNQSYFEQFYTDLADKRFVLIVSEPLNTNIQDRSHAFGEENNAWVKWVSMPILCYYEPLETFKKVRTQLLVPRAEPQDCQW